MSQSTYVDEVNNISNVINHYIEGARTGKGAAMKPAFHEGATIYGYVGPDMFGGPLLTSSISLSSTAIGKSSARCSTFIHEIDCHQNLSILGCRFCLIFLQSLTGCLKSGKGC